MRNGEWLRFVAQVRGGGYDGQQKWKRQAQGETSQSPAFSGHQILVAWPMAVSDTMSCHRIIPVKCDCMVLRAG